MKHTYMVDNEVHRCDGMWVTSFRSLQQSTCTRFIALVLQLPQKYHSSLTRLICTVSIIFRTCRTFVSISSLPAFLDSSLIISHPFHF